VLTVECTRVRTPRAPTDASAAVQTQLVDAGNQVIVEVSGGSLPGFAAVTMGTTTAAYTFATPDASSGSLAASVTLTLAPLPALDQFTAFDTLQLHFPFDAPDAAGGTTACSLSYDASAERDGSAITIIAAADNISVAAGECADCSLSSTPPTGFPRFLQLTFTADAAIPTAVTTAVSAGTPAPISVTCTNIVLRASSSAATTTGLAAWRNFGGVLLAYAQSVRVPAIDVAPFKAVSLGAFNAPAYAGLANVLRFTFSPHIGVEPSDDLALSLTVPSSFHVPFAVCTSPSVPTAVNPGRAFPHARVSPSNGFVTLVLWLPFAVTAGVTVSVECTSVGLPSAASAASAAPGATIALRYLTRGASDAALATALATVDVLASASALEIPAITAYPSSSFAGVTRAVSFADPVAGAVTTLVVTVAPFPTTLSPDRVFYTALPNDILPAAPAAAAGSAAATVCTAAFNGVPVPGTGSFTLTVSQHILRFSPANANATVTGGTAAATSVFTLSCTNVLLPTTDRAATRLTRIAVLSKANEATQYAGVRGARLDEVFSGLLGSASARFDPATAGARAVWELSILRGVDVLPTDTVMHVEMPYGTAAPDASGAGAAQSGVICGYGATRAAADAMRAAGTGVGAVLVDYLPESKYITAISFAVPWVLPVNATAVIACTVLQVPTFSQPASLRTLTVTKDGVSYSGTTVSFAAIDSVPASALAVKAVVLEATAFASTAGVVAVGEYAALVAALTRLPFPLLAGDLFTFEVPSTIAVVGAGGATVGGVAVPPTTCSLDGVSALSYTSAASPTHADSRMRLTLALSEPSLAAGAPLDDGSGGVAAATYAVRCAPMLLPAHETGSLTDGYMSITAPTPSQVRTATTEATFTGIDPPVLGVDLAAVTSSQSFVGQTTALTLRLSPLPVPLAVGDYLTLSFPLSHAYTFPTAAPAGPVVCTAARNGSALPVTVITLRSAAPAADPADPASAPTAAAVTVRLDAAAAASTNAEAADATQRALGALSLMCTRVANPGAEQAAVSAPLAEVRIGSTVVRRAMTNAVAFPAVTVSPLTLAETVLTPGSAALQTTLTQHERWSGTATFSFGAAGLAAPLAGAVYAVDADTALGIVTTPTTAEATVTACTLVGTKDSVVTFAVGTGAPTGRQRLLFTLPAPTAPSSSAGGVTSYTVSCTGVWLPRYAVASFSDGFGELRRASGGATHVAAGSALFRGLAPGVMTGAAGVVEAASNNTAPLITTPMRLLLAPLPLVILAGDVLQVPIPAAFNYEKDSRGTTVCTLRRNGLVVSSTVAWNTAPSAADETSWGGALSSVISFTAGVNLLPSTASIALEALCTQVRNPTANLTAVTFSQMRLLRGTAPVRAVAVTPSAALSFSDVKIPEWGLRLRSVVPESSVAGSAPGRVMLALSPVPVFIVHMGSISFTLPAGWDVVEVVTSTITCVAGVDRLQPEAADIEGQTTTVPDPAGPLIVFRLTNAPVALGSNAVLRLWCSGVSVPTVATPAVTTQAVYAMDDIDTVLMFTERAEIPAITAAAAANNAAASQSVDVTATQLLSANALASVRTAYAQTLGLAASSVHIASQSLVTVSVAAAAATASAGELAVSAVDAARSRLRRRTFAPQQTQSTVVRVAVTIAPSSAWVSSADLQQAMTARAADLRIAVAAALALPVGAIGAAAEAQYEARCSNGLRDGDETDVDCGGQTCVPCAATGATCAATKDCIAGVCSSGKCVASSSVTPGPQPRPNSATAPALSASLFGMLLASMFISALF
jgi:hypothetical protein